MQEELTSVVQLYERRGHFDEVLSLLEAGLSLERAHVRLPVTLPRILTEPLGRWESSPSSLFCTANTDQRSVSHGFLTLEPFPHAHISNGAPQALRLPNQHPQGTINGRPLVYSY